MTKMQEIPIEYIDQKTPYEKVLERQESAVQAVIDGTGTETLFMVEHAPIYTIGSSGEETDVLGTFQDIPTFHTGRGGQVTYHGTGQRVMYPILNLKNHKQDLHWYISQLQLLIKNTLQAFDIESFFTDDVGIWVHTPEGDKKIAAIGVRVRKWVTFHGVALNIFPNLEHYKGIVPCGITNKGITSMRVLGCTASMIDVDKVLLKEFKKLFT